MLNVSHHITCKRFQEQEKKTLKTLDLNRDGNARQESYVNENIVNFPRIALTLSDLFQSKQQNIKLKKTYENVKSDAVSDNDDDDEDYNDVDRNKKKLCDADKYYGNSYEKMTSINYMTVSIDIC